MPKIFIISVIEDRMITDQWIKPTFDEAVERGVAAVVENSTDNDLAEVEKALNSGDCYWQLDDGYWAVQLSTPEEE